MSTMQSPGGGGVGFGSFSGFLQTIPEAPSESGAGSVSISATGTSNGADQQHQDGRGGGRSAGGGGAPSIETARNNSLKRWWHVMSAAVGGDRPMSLAGDSTTAVEAGEGGLHPEDPGLGKRVSFDDRVRTRSAPTDGRQVGPDDVESGRGSLRQRLASREPVRWSRGMVLHGLLCLCTFLAVVVGLSVFFTVTAHHSGAAEAAAQADVEAEAALGDLANTAAPSPPAASPTTGQPSYSSSSSHVEVSPWSTLPPETLRPKPPRDKDSSTNSTVATDATTSSASRSPAPSAGGSAPQTDASFAPTVSPTTSSSPTARPTDPPYVSVEKSIVFDLLRRYATEPEVLSADGTAQRTAMSWISHGDDLGLEVDIGQGGAAAVSARRFVQRYVLAVMYFGLGGEGWKMGDDGGGGRRTEEGTDDSRHLTAVATEEEMAGRHQKGIKSSRHLDVSSLASPTVSVEFVDAKSRGSEISRSYFSVDIAEWMSPYHECNWAGVTCTTLPVVDDVTGKYSGGYEDVVTHVVLNGMGLNGPIPGELEALRSLKELTLFENHITGSIPSRLADLPGLYYLDLGLNDLTGTVPVFGPDLEYLYLNDNMLEGGLPVPEPDDDDAFMERYKLKHLWVDLNDLSGEISEDVAKYSELGEHMFFVVFRMPLMYVQHNRLPLFLTHEPLISSDPLRIAHHLWK